VCSLSPRTVRYLHTIISRVLRQAVRDTLLLRNPAEAKAPEMACWTCAQLGAFLAWARENSVNYASRLSVPATSRVSPGCFSFRAGCPFCPAWITRLHAFGCYTIIV
jgi:hypothetical protein